MEAFPKADLSLLGGRIPSLGLDQPKVSDALSYISPRSPSVVATNAGVKTAQPSRGLGSLNSVGRGRPFAARELHGDAPGLNRGLAHFSSRPAQTNSGSLFEGPAKLRNDTLLQEENELPHRFQRQTENRAGPFGMDRGEFGRSPFIDRRAQSELSEEPVVPPNKDIDFDTVFGGLPGWEPRDVEAPSRTDNTQNVSSNLLSGLRSGTRRDGVFTYRDVARHHTKKDLFFVIHDKVYDATRFVDEHP
jgi:hypothetical protein